MGAQMSDVGVEGIAHRARANHLERLRRLYEQVRRWPAARRRARMSQYRKRWKIWAGSLTCLILSSGNAHATIGSSTDVDNGFKACVSQGSFDVLPNGTTWGGTCNIQLSAGTFVQTATYPKSQTDTVSKDLGTLSWPNQPSGNDVSLRLSTALVTQCSNVTKSTYATGTTFAQNVPVAASTSANVGCAWSSMAPTPHPQDGATGTENAYMGAVGGVLTWNVSVPIGTAITYPNLVLTFDDTNPTRATRMTIGVGGAGGQDPTPPNPPVAGVPPNCTAITGVAAQTYDFGDGTAGTSVGRMTTSKTVAGHSLRLTCTSGPNGSVQANATLYVASSMSKSADNKTLLNPAGDWLGLRLKLPASPQGNGKVATGQTAGDYVVWNGANPTPIWTWDMAAESTHNATVPTSLFTLTPEIYQLQASPGTQDGQRTYTVTYSAVIQ